jgi:predicted short-subunit dehydrogenase-like oxidoreductase (DUF2520 family)
MPASRTSRKARSPHHPRPGVTVVGAGNWGTSLIDALRATGTELNEVVGRRTRREVVALGHARLDAEVLWIAVPDAAIAATTEAIVERCRTQDRDLRGQIVVHSSGALTVEVLDAARRAGAEVASLHPVMTFPTPRPVPLAGVLFGMEAEPGVRRRLTRLVRKLGGEPFALASQSKALYHAAGVLASPLLVAELAAAVETAEAAGLTRRQASRLVETLATASAANFFQRGPAKSFSGPLARGDAATIDLHLRAMLPHPMVGEVYRALALYALDALPVRERNNLRAALRRQRSPRAPRKTK